MVAVPAGSGDRSSPPFPLDAPPHAPVWLRGVDQPDCSRPVTIAGQQRAPRSGTPQAPVVLVGALWPDKLHTLTDPRDDTRSHTRSDTPASCSPRRHGG